VIRACLGSLRDLRRLLHLSHSSDEEDSLIVSWQFIARVCRFRHVNEPIRMYLYGAQLWLLEVSVFEREPLTILYFSL